MRRKRRRLRAKPTVGLESVAATAARLLSAKVFKEGVLVSLSAWLMLCFRVPHEVGRVGRCKMKKVKLKVAEAEASADSRLPSQPNATSIDVVPAETPRVKKRKRKIAAKVGTKHECLSFAPSLPEQFRECLWQAQAGAGFWASVVGLQLSKLHSGGRFLSNM